MVSGSSFTVPEFSAKPQLPDSQGKEDSRHVLDIILGKPGTCHMAQKRKKWKRKSVSEYIYICIYIILYIYSNNDFGS